MASDGDGPVPFDALTTTEGLTNWLLKRRSQFNVLGKKSTFQAKVLTEPRPLSAADAAAAGQGAGTQFHYMAMVRITDPRMAHENYLDDPCDVSTSDPVLATQLYSFHTRMLIPPLHGDSRLPEIDDYVDIVLEPGGFCGAPYDLQFGQFLKITDRPPAADTSVSTEVCQPLPDAFMAGGLGLGSYPNSNAQRGAYVGSAGTVAVINGTLESNGLIARAKNGCSDNWPPVLVDVVDDWSNLAAAFADHFDSKGWKLGATGGDRTYETQVRLRADWCRKGQCKKAAVPGTSNHGWGVAVDASYCDGSEIKSLRFDGEAYAWLFINAPKYNWENPCWAQNPATSERLGRKCVGPCGRNDHCGGNQEPWHWESTKRHQLIKRGDSHYEQAAAATSTSVPEGTSAEPAESEET